MGGSASQTSTNPMSGNPIFSSLFDKIHQQQNPPVSTMGNKPTNPFGGNSIFGSLYDRIQPVGGGGLGSGQQPVRMPVRQPMPLPTAPLPMEQGNNMPRGATPTLFR